MVTRMTDDFADGSGFTIAFPEADIVDLLTVVRERYARAPRETPVLRPAPTVLAAIDELLTLFDKRVQDSMSGVAAVASFPVSQAVEDEEANPCYGCGKPFTTENPHRVDDGDEPYHAGCWSPGCMICGEPFSDGRPGFTQNAGGPIHAGCE